MRWVGKLAMIELPEDQVSEYASTLTKVLTYIDTLSEVDTNKVDETMQITGLDNVTQADIHEQCEIPREQLLANAPASERGFVKVRSVFDR